MVCLLHAVPEFFVMSGDDMVYYIGYYNCDAIRCEERITAAAAENKMRYVKTALREAWDGQIEIVNPAETRLRRPVKGRKLRLDDRVGMKTFSSFSSRFRLLRASGHLWTKFLFAAYLFLNVKPAGRPGWPAPASRRR